MMRWLQVMRWLPWRWESDVRVTHDVDAAQRRLDESECIRRDAAVLGRKLHHHLRHNQFGDMIEREVYRGGGA